jgi:hypothetical protein
MQVLLNMQVLRDFVTHAHLDVAGLGNRRRQLSGMLNAPARRRKAGMRSHRRCDQLILQRSAAVWFSHSLRVSTKPCIRGGIIAHCIEPL